LSFSGEAESCFKLVTSTFFRNEPFGGSVEGLSHYGDESYAVQPAVQTDDFEDSTL
jgi:hypothetical protein